VTLILVTLILVALDAFMPGGQAFLAHLFLAGDGSFLTAVLTVDTVPLSFFGTALRWGFPVADCRGLSEL